MPESDNYQEKRKEKRIIVVELDVVREDTGENLGKIINLSQGGMLIMRAAPLAVDSVLTIKTKLDQDLDNEIDLITQVRVAWVRQNDISNFYSIGFEFIDTSPEQLELIDKIIGVFGSA